MATFGVATCSVGLASLAADSCNAVCRDMQLLAKLRGSADDEVFQREWAAVKREAKVKAAAFIKDHCGVAVSPDVMFDVQV
jgi:glycogen phosphorylase